MDEKSVAIVTLYNPVEVNFGNKFQNYATEFIYQSLQFKVESLVIRPPFGNKEVFKIYCKRIVNALLGYKFSDNQNKWKRYLSFTKFDRRWLHIKHVKVNDKEFAKKYNFISVGSDQVWNPTWMKPEEEEWFFLISAKREQRICLAPSFGVSEISQRKQEKFKDMLNGFPYISVRENAGKKIVEKLTGRCAEVLIDPTLMLDRKEWNQLAKKPRILKKQDEYILCYFLGTVSDELQKKIQILAEQYGLYVYNVMDKKSKLYGIGPSEFLWMIAHAKLICTDSFHACVFSFLYSKPFLVFNRQGKADNMFSRIETLLVTFGLERKYVNSGLKNDVLEADYSNGYEILEKERSKVREFLRKSIGGCYES